MDPSDAGVIETERRGDVVLLRLFGEHDTTTKGPLVEALDGLAWEGKGVVEVVDYADAVPVLQPADDRRSGLAYVGIVSDRWAGSTTTRFFVWAEIDVNTNGLVRRPTKAV